MHGTTRDGPPLDLSIGVRASIMRARMYASETSTYCTGVVAHSAMVARLCHGKGDRTQVSVVTGEETTRVLANDRLVASINISIHLHRYVPSPHLALQARLSVYLFIIHAPHQFGSVHIPGGTCLWRRSSFECVVVDRRVSLAVDTAELLSDNDLNL